MFIKLIATSTGRARLILTVAAGASLALAASAAAVVYIYSNSFGSTRAYREIDQTGGGKNACQESYGKDAHVMHIEMSGKTFCEYSPPVTGDSAQPDHEIVVSGRILDSTPKNTRDQAYLGARVRVGDDTYYELRVTPKGKKYRLTRNPAGGGSGLPITGQSNKIKPIGTKNTLRLRITGSDVDAFVNGKSVATYHDPNPGQVTGRKVSFGIGSTKDSRKGPIGSFKSVRVGIPSP
jgi:hypothetical protein